MPRDGGGFYVLPPGNPVVPGTVIESDWANPTMEDFKAEMSDSLSRSGKGGMLAALRGPDGSAAVPTFSFTNEPATGRFRDGPGQVVEAVDGTPVVRYLASGLEQWDSDVMDWVPLTPRNALGTPFDPAPTNLTSTNVQDAIEEVNTKTGGAITADSVTYDDSNVYFAASTVQIALDAIGFDIPPLAQDILANAEAIQLLDGDLTLAEQRITLNEQNIGANATQIGLNKTLSEGNRTDIDINQGLIFGLQGDISDNEGDIADNKTTADSAWNKAWNVNPPLISAAQQDADTAQSRADSAYSYADANRGILNDHYGYMFGPGGLSDRISDNAGDISDNAADISNIESVFPGGVLQVSNGGTGVTTKSGTGAGVHTTGPEVWSINLYSGEIWTSVLCATQSLGEDSRKLASTAFVQNAIDNIGGGGGLNIATASNSSGRYMAVYSGSGSWYVLCWSAAVFQAGGTTDYFPVGHSSSSTIQIAGMLGDPVASSVIPACDSITTTSFTGYAPGRQVRWHSAGLAEYQGAYKDVVPTDRYFNKVTKTEHVEILHGDWTLDPAVVILPPGNAFWGEPMEPDEVMTFDVDGLPLARVPRTISPEEVLHNLLQADGITPAAMDKALYLAGRGTTGPLTALDNALDAIVLSEGVTLEALLELM